MQQGQVISLSGKTEPNEAWEQAHHRTLIIADSLKQGFSNFLEAGYALAIAFRQEDWNVLGLENFTDYCAQFRMSKSWGYDLVRIAEFVEKYKDYSARVLDAGISNMRLLLPTLCEASERDDEERIDELLDDANTKSWDDLRQQLNGDDHEKAHTRGYSEARCPHCNRLIWLSRECDVFGEVPAVPLSRKP